MSNPSVGRHFIGKPIAKSGTKPKPRTGSASGGFVGTGKNSKTSASPEYSPSRSSGAVTSGTQLEQWNSQAPEPFRNPQASANPQPLAPQQSGGPNKAYQPFRGSRISVDDGDTTNLGGSPSAVGIKGSYGRGREQGRVAGTSQPKRKGNVYNQPKAKFYGA